MAINSNLRRIAGLVLLALVILVPFSYAQSDATPAETEPQVTEPPNEAPVDVPAQIDEVQNIPSDVPAAEPAPSEESAADSSPEQSDSSGEMMLLSESYTPVSFQAIQPQTKVKPDGYYETGLFTGAATYGYDLPTMPGTDGLAPSFSLSYSSQNALERGWVGNGWSLGDNYVSRDVNGTLANWSDDEYQLHLNGARYDLVYVPSDGLFHTKETALYASKKPYDFGAGGKGLDLLRMKVYGQRFGFDLSMISKRCVYIPTDRDQCPGDISRCPHVRNAKECATSGGTTFTVAFQPKKASQPAHI